MSDVTSGYVYGLRQIKLTSYDDTPVEVMLPAARTLSFSESFTEAELEGDDKVVAAVAFPKSVEWEMEAGGITLEALAVMTGETVTLTGTTPDQVETMKRNAGTASPYFKIEGRSIGDSGDDILVTIPKAKLSSFDGNLEFETFTLSSCSGKAIDDGTNGLYSVAKRETAAALS